MGNVHVRATEMVLFTLLWLLVLSQTSATPFQDKSEQQSPALEEADKRRADRYSFFSQLGKRDGYQDGQDINISERGRMDSMMFHGSLGKRAEGGDTEVPERLGDLDQGEVISVDKRGRLDQYGFAGMLGKRKMDRFGFFGSLGKREGQYAEDGGRGLDDFPYESFGEDDVDFTNGVDKRGRMDRYSFYGSLGKRDYRRPMQFFGQLGKRRMDLKGLMGQLGKRSRRASDVPWSLWGRQYPGRQVRGMDRFSFMSRLGKRAPNYGFYPQLGKRADDSFDTLDSAYGYDAQL